jgi:KDO2-lipid IV(A) lauroyltransferase
LPQRSLLEQAQFRLEALGFDAGAELIRALGPDRAAALGSALWRQLAPFNKRHQRADRHLQAAMPTLMAADRARLLDRMWDNLGRTSAEAFHLSTLVCANERFEIGPDFHEAITLAKARGAVFVSLHLGNWELASPLLYRHGLPVAGVYQRLRNPFVDARVTEARSPHYALGLYGKSNETAWRLMRIVSNRGTVTIIADLRDLNGISVPFFGIPAPSTPFPALLARGRDVPLFAGAVMRLSGGRFRVLVREVPVHRKGDLETGLMETTAAIQRQFEEFIRLVPEQWMWGHRRWSR